MQRVEDDKQWTLFSPQNVPLLRDAYGEQFDILYTEYESSTINQYVVRARDLWKIIVEAQIETGGPFMLYKDAINGTCITACLILLSVSLIIDSTEKSNQSHLGPITCSNLCTEIVQFSSPTETAVCNLASVGLPKFVLPDGNFDFGNLHRIVQIITVNLNKIIDSNYYPIPEASVSNLRHRSIGIGVQGLADTFMAMAIPFESQEASELNVAIFETMYHAALHASMKLAMDQGPHETWPGSPASRGFLQYDLWGVVPTTRWDWDSLKVQIMRHGLRNSLLIAPMPTAGTSQITGFSECFEAGIK